jgi:hypothetical protein
METEEKNIGSTHISNVDSDNTANIVQIATDVDDSNDSPWTWSMFRLYAVLSVAYLCGCLNGFDGSLMGAINAMKQYQDYFEMWVLLFPAFPRKLPG